MDFDKFISELAKYYELSMDDIATSIEKLAEIQENFSEEYNRFVTISENPELLIDLKLDDKVKSIFFEMLLKSASLTQKVNKLIILTPIEKKALAKDLKSYVSELKNKLEKIKEK